MDKWEVRMRLHGYNEHGEGVTCYTAKVPDFQSACRAKEEVVRLIEKENSFFKEAFLQVTFYHNNQVVYNNSGQII